MTQIIADQPADATSDAPGPEFLPIRGLADILTALLAVVAAFICVRLAVQLLSPGSVRYFTDFRLDKAADITMLGLSILFLVWFYRARINAERHGYPSGTPVAGPTRAGLSPSSTSGSPSRSWVTSGGPGCQPGSAARPRGCLRCGGHAGCSADWGSSAPGPCRPRVSSRTQPLAQILPACASSPWRAHC
jgi:hypothetical protein